MSHFSDYSKHILNVYFKELDTLKVPLITRKSIFILIFETTQDYNKMFKNQRYATKARIYSLCLNFMQEYLLRQSF